MHALAAQRGFSVASISSAWDCFSYRRGRGLVTGASPAARRASSCCWGAVLRRGHRGIGHVQAEWQMYLVYALFGVGYTAFRVANHVDHTLVRSRDALLHCRFRQRTVVGRRDSNAALRGVAGAVADRTSHAAARWNIRTVHRADRLVRRAVFREAPRRAPLHRCGRERRLRWRCGRGSSFS